MGGSISEFDQALAEAEEEKRELQAMAAVAPITEPEPVKRRGRPPKAKLATVETRQTPEMMKIVDGAVEAVVAEDAAEKFVAYVRLYLKACAVRRADRTLFEDRCIACERRGVHSRDRFRCDCACHPLRELLPPA